jgi:hypothetical protein
MARKNPNSPANGGNITLNEAQEQEIANLQAQRAIYEEQLVQANKKRNKIREILDSFELIVAGNAIIDIFGVDENADEILNSIIISKTDILNHANNQNYPLNEFDFLAGTLDNILNTDRVKELINESSILNEGELYALVWYQLIETVDNGGVGPTETTKSAISAAISAIENKVKEPDQNSSR